MSWDLIGLSVVGTSTDLLYTNYQGPCYSHVSSLIEVFLFGGSKVIIMNKLYIKWKGHKHDTNL